jgi:tRNA 2-thiouridine synthesizing protein B
VILHTLNASPSASAFDDCLKVLRSDDALLLMGDGVYAAIAGTSACTALSASGAKIYLLRADAAAAGISKPGEGMGSIDMDGFVSLTEKYPRQLAWY